MKVLLQSVSAPVKDTSHSLQLETLRYTTEAIILPSTTFASKYLTFIDGVVFSSIFQFHVPKRAWTYDRNLSV